LIIYLPYHGKLCSVCFDGVLLAVDVCLHSTKDQGQQPFEFTVGVGQVIAGMCKKLIIYFCLCVASLIADKGASRDELCGRLQSALPKALYAVQITEVQ